MWDIAEREESMMTPNILLPEHEKSRVFINFACMELVIN